MEMAKKDRGQPTGAELRAADQRTAPVQSTPTRPTRRTYTAAYKLEILRQADAALSTGEPGAVGALLRREGLYTSHLANWRAQRETGELAALEPKKRGPAPTRNPLADEVARLQRENTKLQEPYWAEPHTVPSPSGTRAVFGSDWGNGDTVDTYVVELPSYEP